MMNQTTHFKMSVHRLLTMLFTLLLVGLSHADEQRPAQGEDVVLELGDWKVTHTDDPAASLEAQEADEVLSTLWTLAKQLLVICAIAGILILLLMRFLPNHPLVKRLMLPNVTSGDTEAPVSASGGESIDASSELIGLEGIAQTDLRPTGKGLFGERMLDVTTDAEFIADGANLKIVATEGARVVVEVTS